MKTPCKSCPWRIGAKASDIPGFKSCMAEQLRDTRNVMACHHSTEADPRACAGWVVRVAVPQAAQSGFAAVPMRLLLMRAKVNPLEYSAGGARLHRTSDKMVDAIVASAAREV